MQERITHCAAFRSVHFLDDSGAPEGGVTTGRGFTIAWQHGPLGKIGSPDRKDPNGAFVEYVLEAAKDRLELYQSTRFACDENAEAIAAIGDAIEQLQSRTKRRIDALTEGTLEKN